MDFEVVGPLRNIETIATGQAIRELKRLRRRYGKGRWRKRKGIATVRLQDETIHKAEVHWYECSRYRPAGDEDQVPATGLRNEKTEEAGGPFRRVHQESRLRSLTRGWEAVSSRPR